MCKCSSQTEVHTNQLEIHCTTIEKLCVSLFQCLGNKCVCVNAATMALIDAGVPMKDFVCACSAGYIEDTPLLGRSGQLLYI